MKVDYQAGIIGTGFGGLIAALELKNSGRDSFVIFERAAEPGGTWRDNIYPGCGCDVRSNLYSISSQLNPNWGSSYSSQPEILQYLKDVIANNDLQKHIRYNSNIVQMQFIAAEGCWEITDQNNNTYRVKMMILATGPYNYPYIPVFPGEETFEGKKFHSYNWDKTVDVTGKKVAVIGTGASAIQIVPQIAQLAEQLTVFQRTPAWITSRNNKQATPVKKWLFRHLPFTQKISREGVYWFNEFIGKSFVGNDKINNLITQWALKKLKDEVKDPAIRRKLVPNYKIGCKRILVSDDFYPTFNRPNVKLVTRNITQITKHEVHTKGKAYEADIIILATGFIAADINPHIKVAGLEGHLLAEEWGKTGAEAYKGITVSGYPNMALILGPNTGLGHSSVVHMMESQMEYIMQYIKKLDKLGENGYLDVKPEAQKAYNDDLQAKFKNTVWASGCKSFYMNKEGKNTTLYPRLTREYRQETKRFDEASFVAVGASVK